MPDATDETDLYDALGATDAPFFALVDAFYRHVEADAPLRAVYPPDLGPGKRHLAWFLIQRFGGPSHFNQQRGAPMLRRRHMEFPIDAAQAHRWLASMSAAIDETPAFASYKPALLRYFEDAALFLVNHAPRERAEGLAQVPLAAGLPGAGGGE